MPKKALNKSIKAKKVSSKKTLTSAKKIRKADIDAVLDPMEKEATRGAAIQSRKAHMLMGAPLSWEILREFDQQHYIFSRLDIRRIQELIRRHDDPTVEELTGTNSGEWLFLPEERLLRLHREADRLWMLTPEGLEVDLVRDEKKTGQRDPLERLQGNIKRHHDEGKLYRQAFGGEAGILNLRGNTFYSTDTTHALYNRFIEESAHFYNIDLSAINRE